MAIKKNIDKTCDYLGVLPFVGGLFKAKPKIAVIRLSGVIADAGLRKQGISYARCEKIIEAAFDVYNLKAVAVVINSPGGSPAQSELIANLIRREAEDKEIPVYAFVEDVAASGGYWLACAADKIFAAETSITGSIGVISASFGFQKLMDQYGVERRIHTSGKDKSFLDPFIEEKPADVKKLKELQGKLHESFKDWVRERRAGKLKGDEKDLFEGAFWVSEQALEFGIIDAVGDVKSVCREEFGEDIKFTEFSPDKGLISGLIGAKLVKSSIPEDILSLVEDQSLWKKFGL